MTRVSERHKEIINDIIELIYKKVPEEQAGLLEKFVKYCYAMVADEDLTDRNVNDLYGAVVSHWNFLFARSEDQFKVRVFNPIYEQHGWQSNHTIIEIIQKDMPFLVESLRMALLRQGITIHLMIHVGGIQFRRNKQGKITDVFPPELEVDKDIIAEAPIYLEIDQQTDPEVIENLQKIIKNVLADVMLAVNDWEAMRDKAYELVAELENSPPPINFEELQESIDFIRWIANHNFTFLGCRDYEIVKENGQDILKMINHSGLGLLREEHVHHENRKVADLPPQARDFALSPDKVLIIQQLSLSSTVHRPSEPYYIGVKRINKKGVVIGERRFIGLYTSVAYNSSPTSIPFLRRKVDHVLALSGFPKHGHSCKVVLNILETFPRDELFQATEEELYSMAIGIFQMQERQRIRLFYRKDPYDRFYSCLVYVPREKFNSNLREKMGNILKAAFGGCEIQFTTQFSESVLARIHFIIKLKDKQPRLEVDGRELRKKLVAAGRTWQDDLYDALSEYYGEAMANKLYQKYCSAFPAGYIEYFPARTAVHDIEHMESLIEEKNLQMSFYRPLEGIDGQLHFKIFCFDSPIPLSDILPMLENLWLRVIGEQSHDIKLCNGTNIWICDFGLLYEHGQALNVDKIRDVFHQAFAQIWRGNAENDGFNRLVLSIALTWRETAILRAYAKYFRQIGFTFSQNYIEETLSKHCVIAKKLVNLFQMRFDPALSATERGKIVDLKTRIIKDLDGVQSLDEDKILRRYLDVIMATLRTNYYQKDASGELKPYFSFKLDPSAIPEMELPIPKLEFFVYSTNVEGVHLRTSNVARGGLRWSDRKEDFRTEVLGLMKAQQVKNAVIVPEGAKGGFVVKSLDACSTRDEVMNEVVRCYSIFIRGMLDLTDNRCGDKIIYPKDVVRHDDDDVYLVVAADKGTATFSDIANKISEEYGYWLGDAFASGGSAGYDHKAIGITARSAWESVKRHFRKLGQDIQTSDFTVVGIGDMSGDVFGNGMLLSRHIRLVAAFNHQHIFLDPTPDAESSYLERERLFNLPRSSWADYNNNLLSKGGGIFSRTAKSIKLNPEIKTALDIEESVLAPNELIKSILRAPIDLLFNGGIGTYVKATQERNADVADKTNDALRINGKELRCRVIGEGGNLGLTQLGRVEYALNDGILFTDFIDNAGGVDCSDHEVNIKILLDSVVVNGDLTQKQRNQLLSEMTDDVAQLVLSNSYYQAQAISHAASRAPATIDEYRRFIQSIERMGHLNRELEYIPNDEELADRKSNGLGLTNPELSVLLAISKIILKEELLNSDVPEDEYLSNGLATAFPSRLAERYCEQMYNHQLKREIIATQLSNSINNEMGATFIHRLYDETGAPASFVARSFSVAREIFDMPTFWSEIEKLDLQVETHIQMEMRTDLARLIRRATRWFLRNRRSGLNIGNTVKHFKPPIQELNENMSSLLIGQEAQRVKEICTYYVESHVPEKLAAKISETRPMISALDIIDAASENNFAVTQVAETYFALGAYLQLDWFRTEIGNHPVTNNWDALARAACKDDLDRQQRSITEGILQYKTADNDVNNCIKLWINENQILVDRWCYMVSDLKATKSKAFSMFAVALRELLDLAQASTRKLNIENQ